MPLAADSYVERSADKTLLDALLSGKFCYVLNSRQMGKSSLCVRTMKRLDASNIRTAFVDLTKIGGRNVTAEQWYAGIAAEIGRSLELRNEVLAYWKENGHVSPLQRLFGSIREVALEKIETPVAIFFDEIDATRSLPFSADEFFAAIRESYNRRVHDPAYKRLSFCLLGVAVPSDLINSPTSTPFNIGERIYLRDFTLDEAMALAGGLERPAGGARATLERVYHWTNGHPYLTQSLCAAIAADSAIRTPLEVDALVRRDLFEPKARETNINLADVANRALHAGDLEEDAEKFRADLLSAYEKAWKGNHLADDESNRVAALLKLSGIMRSEGNQLKVRNRIYEHVFDKAWIRENMPGQELRRQRRAFYLGVLRTTAIAATVVGVVGWLAWNNSKLAAQNARQRDQANYDLYAASMGNLSAKDDANDIAAIRRILDATKDNPARGWEWKHWNIVAHPGDVTILTGGDEATAASLDLSMRRVALATRDALTIYELPSGRTLRTLPLPDSSTGRWSAQWMRNGALVAWDSGKTVLEVDPETGSILKRRTFSSPIAILGAQTFPLGNDLPVIIVAKKETDLLDLTTLELRPLPHLASGRIAGYFSANRDGTRMAMIETGPSGRDEVSVRATSDWHEVAGLPTKSDTIQGFGWSADDRYLSFSDENDEEVICVDLESGRIRLRKRLGEFLGAPCLSRDGGTILVPTEKRRAIEIDSTTGELLAEFPEASAVWMLDNGAVLTSYWDMSFYKNGVAERGEREISLPPGNYAWAHISMDGHLIADGGPTRLRYGLDLNSQSPITTLTSQAVTKGYEDKAGTISTLWMLDHVDVFEQASGKKLFQSPLTELMFNLIAGSPGGRFVVVPFSLRAVQVHDLTGKLAVRSLSTKKFPEQAEFSPDGSTLALGDSGGWVTFYRTSDWREVSAMQACRNGVGPMTFSADGKRLAVVDDQELVILDVAMARVSARMIGSSNHITCECFSPDRKRVVTGSEDGAVRIWDPETGTDLGPIGSHPRPVLDVGFIDGGKTLVSISDKGQVMLWLTDRRGP